MGKLFLVILEISVALILGYFLIKAIWPNTPKTSYESLEALKEKSERAKQERSTIKDEASSVERTLKEIKENTN